jgi:hypothetical protein
MTVRHKRCTTCPAVKVNLNANLNAQADLLLLNPTYTFATPVDMKNDWKRIFPFEK